MSELLSVDIKNKYNMQIQYFSARHKKIKVVDNTKCKHVR